MIKRFKRWLGRVAEQHMRDNHPVPTVVSHGNMPTIQVYKISNGYLVSKTAAAPYREDSAAVIYCATPLDVARQIINAEALEKMGIQAEQISTGYASAKLGTQTNPVPTL